MIPFFKCSIRLGPYCMPHHDLIDGLSLLHLVPEILGTKVGLICHQNVLFNRFFFNFLVDFLQLTPFLLILDIFDSSFLQNLTSDWVLFYRLLNIATDNLVKYPLSVIQCSQSKKTILSIT